MNLVKFLKQVDSAALNMQSRQLCDIIHEFAKTLPEYKRADFLLKIESIKQNSNNPSNIQKNDEQEYNNLKKNVQDTIKILKKINIGERCIKSEYNEEWDEWYDKDEEEFIFSDAQDITSDIEKAIELVHKCIDTENFKDGLQLAQTLYDLEIHISGDYSDYQSSCFEIGDLYYYELVDGKLEDFIKEFIFLTYIETEFSERAEKIYSIIYHYENIKLEDIMHFLNSDLAASKEFLPLWLKYLGKQAGERANELLLEVLNMIDDKEILLESARIYYDKHPELYKEILEDGKNKENISKMLKIGLEALGKIPVSYVIRGKIALLTADYALKLNDIQTAENCYIEAFKSDTSFINYLRVRFVSRDYSKYAEEVKQIYEKIHSQKLEDCKIYEYRQRENSLGHNDYCAILFFEKEFEKFIEIGMSKKESLGWSATFMKEAIALILLLLYKETNIPAGLDKMVSIAANNHFISEKFVLGTNIDEKDDKKQFLELFNRWKKNITIKKEDYNNWMAKIEQLIEIRIKGIMEKSRTKYYWECAAFIAAWGEVAESNGVKYAKERIASKYKSQYSRRHSFTAELKKFADFNDLDRLK